jgi:ketosteroid isomerase-like protein
VPAETGWLNDAYDAFNRGEWDRSGEFMHDEVSWHFVEGVAPDAPEVLNGREEIVEFWSTFLEAWEEWEMAPTGFVAASEERIIVPIRFRARGSGSGVPMELEFCQVLTLAGERIYRVDQYLSRGSAEEACPPLEAADR